MHVHPSMKLLRWLIVVLAAGLTGLPFGTAASPAPGEKAAQPAGEPVLEPPTLHSLGVYWAVQGDANKNARIALRYRKAGAGEWRDGAPLFRVERGAHQPGENRSKVGVPQDGWLFAGSLLLLEPATSYELNLRLSDPDGGSAEKTLRSRTIAEPVAPAALRTYHVVPGGGGGSGTEADPFRGLAAAREKAQAGTLFLLHKGVYEGTFEVLKSGETARPVVWRGAGDGEAILAGKDEAGKRAGRVVDATGIHDVWFEDLTLRNADYALVGHNSSRLVIRRCRMNAVEFGITCTNNRTDMVNGWFISDNILEGPSTWPRTKGIEDARGIQVTGMGHVVCYNRIRGFGDAIDTFPSGRVAAIDFHNNDVSELTDDGIEMDYSERNTRCFFNRLTNVFQGISVQPVYGGPVYIFRNVLYNVEVEPFKMHNSPSGVLLFHNTCVKKGSPLLIWTSAPNRNCVSRNNLFIGTDGRAAFDCDSPMIDCDFDYDGFGGGPWVNFLKWNNVRYKTLEEVKAKAPVYRHAIQVDPATVFASGIRPPEDVKKVHDVRAIDLRLKAGTAAVDAGEVLPGINDGYAGRAPDLGAYELGGKPPHYGPRPAK
jgi:hypothetical protein